MKGGLYLRLAWDGLRKNRQLSWPYLLTCVGMVAMHYILAFLASPTALEKLPQGRQTIETMMALGCLVVLLFSLIFLFYTYSFLNRRRAREFGLYNVLGMGKRNLSRIVLWESAITAAQEDVKAGLGQVVPRQLQNKHYDGEEREEKGQHYVYPHLYPNHWFDQQYLPDDIRDHRYYQPGENKNEQAFREYWKKIKGTSE